MIGTVIPFRIYATFVGGGGLHVKEVLERLSKKTEILALPQLNEINLLKHYNICDKLDNLPFMLPKVIKRACNGEKFSYEEILQEYKKETKDVKILYEPLADFYMNTSSRLLKFKLFLSSFKPTIPCNEDLSVDAYCISKISGKKLVTVIQTDYFRSYYSAFRFLYGSLKYRIGDPLFSLKYRYAFFNIAKFKRIMREPLVKYILLVSKGTLDSVNLKSDKIKVLDPGNAFNPEILKYRTKQKEDYLVFWARLNYLKGIFEIPYILREVIKVKNNAKLIIFGKFPNNNEKEKLFEIIKKLGLEKNIIYLGFISDDEKYKIVSKARALIYPTHEDVFPLVILESLAVGTPVVSYDLPGPMSVYGSLDAVKFVKEFDVKAMAKEVLKILSMKEEDYFNLIYNEKLDKFLEKHNNWDKVADEIFKYLSD
ncbi:glycosyltransferase [Sulfurisphaera ohwakuensis]|uniref:Glycosyltransferase n=1 Tax=Sulfurisphaera ohwakuensis TaxID=69656 RepID=A0A650CIJ8_SULOH|nr:glycosyltransferase [Sulfurisphaera ohwakuensis]MBB5254989.1 glycosyltransferase involved in cell wall biosynthesis [Sulfurisphaera ohwakuensis]QGR17640.1 glycosyltransferase [Sulfurisphaera ohwakuensis]